MPRASRRSTAPKAAARSASVVIVGEGAWFSAGGSLQRLRGQPRARARGAGRKHRGAAQLIDSIRTFPKPVIAAVEGAAAGAGFSLALACDFVVAARDAFFAASYSNVALSPDGGLSWHLARALPRQLASEWLMGGERIGAPRLHALGLVNELAESGQALATALALAERLNARAPNALASIKELLGEARGASLPPICRRSAITSCATCTTPTPASALPRFWPKQTPHYE